MRLENVFNVPAPPSRAWEILNDIPRVIPCMPGAELNEVIDENTFTATMHVKVGPVSFQFASEIRRVNADAASKSVVLAVKAREVKGRGAVDATIESSLAADAAGTDVTVLTDLALQGPVAQYGRGIVGDVASQLTTRFAQSLARELAADVETRAPVALEPVGGLRLGLAVLRASLLRVLRIRSH
jgi:carbon monoxide dehydrogenase subunit G